jgi:uncharacterized protein YceK
VRLAAAILAALACLLSGCFAVTLRAGSDGHGGVNGEVVLDFRPAAKNAGSD